MTLQHWIYLITAVLTLNIALLLLLLLRRAPGSGLAEQLAQHKLELVQQQGQFQQQLLEQQHLQRQHLQQQQQEHLLQVLQKITDTQQSARFELSKNLQQQAIMLAEQVKQLTQSIDQRLKDIAGQVERRLSEGFEKTNQTFTDIVKRLALIDDAQKKITELSTNVVSLQEVLADKRSRGAFGEVQLTALIRNVMPEQHFSLQHTLSNGRIADCVLFLPKPSGNIVIDAKFPLESYKKMTEPQFGPEERRLAQRQFKLDIKKHINDIADKYIIANETSDGAIMFLPAEAIFAELHAYHADIVEEAYRRRVWLTSPTTLMAVLTTARSVLKDDATRRQIHLIQEHLIKLAEDFDRFRGRFDNLAKHIDQAATDVKQIHTSAHKISSRFSQIEKVEWLEERD
ncbi:DNA recombination protein RmuC [Rheinheimera pacifica]|jgi:DNA recombination protein RmuC|uniref:DNA recombination protein RmuC n=1 Tax=Rheinheimera pacifica TaxID=173990 RepID=UPI0021679999|nr:DNA recombination protein RmuC [Rheinheimera pacifica]MCS4307585.1 DNA recombination protein RmuC [Rheinheimera pacifica]